MADVGYSFAPGNGGSNGQRATPATSTQDAIQILRFRLPSIVGASAPAPPQFMQGPTAQGAQMGGSMAEQFLRRLFGGQGVFNPSMNPMPNLGMGQSPMGQSPMSSPMAPSPSFFGGDSQGQSNGLPVSFQFGDPNRDLLPNNIINESMPPSPTNTATGNQFVDFNRPDTQRGIGGGNSFGGRQA